MKPSNETFRLTYSSMKEIWTAHVGTEGREEVLGFSRWHWLGYVAHASNKVQVTLCRLSLMLLVCIHSDSRSLLLLGSLPKASKAEMQKLFVWLPGWSTGKGKRCASRLSAFPVDSYGILEATE